MTQVAQVRAHLEAGKTITPASAMAVYGIFRLASVIEDLRKAGMKIDTVLKRDETGKQYGEYRKARVVTKGCEVQVKPGHGWGLPGWVRRLRNAKVVDSTACGTSHKVEFVRGKNRAEFWLNREEVVNVSA